MQNETESKSSNLTEAAIVEAILAVGEESPEGSIGLVMPHRAQHSLLTGRLAAFTHAVDVRSVCRAAIGARTEFVLSIHRANVAFSRAKKRLIVVV